MRRLLLAIALLVALPVPVSVLVASAEARTVKVAVEDKDWSPYYIWKDGELEGACAEVAAGALRYMGAEPEFVRYPWIRVLQSIERQTVDGALRDADEGAGGVQPLPRGRTAPLRYDPDRAQR